MQTVQYTVTMQRPDRVKRVTRQLFGTAPANVSSLRQLASYLTHVLYADRERGPVGTIYHVTERIGDSLDGFTVQKHEDGTYRQI